METNGNAIHGYFFNHAGAHCRDAMRGLDLVGAVRTADILRRAIAVFPNGDVPTDHGERQVVLCDLPDEVQWGLMGKLTDELFQETEDVAGLVQKYVAAHRQEFPVLYEQADA